MAEKDAVSVEPPANNNHGEQHEVQLEKRKWYRTTLFNAFVIGGAGFLAPGLWNAMNSLGAAGAEQPFLINAANALVFALSRWIVEREFIQYPAKDVSSGLPLSVWRTDCQSYWLEMDAGAQHAGISDLFVCFTRL